jgi:hypothetical protein
MKILQNLLKKSIYQLLISTVSSYDRSKHRSNSNDVRRSGSETRHRSSNITKRSPPPASYHSISFLFFKFQFDWILVVDSSLQYTFEKEIFNKDKLKFKNIKTNKLLFR